MHKITFCVRFDSCRACNVKYFCHDTAWPRMRLDHPVLKTRYLSYFFTRKGLLQSPGVWALRSPPVRFGARPYFQWREKYLCRKLGSQPCEHLCFWEAKSFWLVLAQKNLLTGVRVCSTRADEVYVVYRAWFKKTYFSFAAWWTCIRFSFAGIYQYPLFHPNSGLLKVHQLPQPLYHGRLSPPIPMVFLRN